MNQFYARFPFGKGMNLGLGIGYAINENVSVELSINTQVITGAEFNNDWNSYIEDASSWSVSGINGYAKIKNTNIQIAPLFIYTGSWGKFNPYIKAGINLIYSQAFSENNSKLIISFFSDTVTSESKYKYKGGINLGFRGAFGAKYSINRRFSVYGEFMVVNTNYNYRKSEVLVNLRNGENLLPEEEEERIEDITHNEGLRDFSSVGINFGIRYQFIRSR
jgi:hypothetical protein